MEVWWAHSHSGKRSSSSGWQLPQLTLSSELISSDFCKMRLLCCCFPQRVYLSVFAGSSALEFRCSSLGSHPEVEGTKNLNVGMFQCNQFFSFPLGSTAAAKRGYGYEGVWAGGSCHPVLPGWGERVRALSARPCRALGLEPSPLRGSSGR